MTTTRLALRNFKGTPTKFFRVEAENLASATPVTVKKPTHHIIVIDRSGSMYYDLDALKGTVEKLLTLQEFNDDSQRISLISYSSQGDVKLHFSKVTVADVMAANSPQLAAIRAIRVTGLTCISQSLVMAETIVDDNDVTCVTLHTDGYANDRSPSSEAKEIQAAVAKLVKHPGLFVNTIAYRDWCDFGLLTGIANQGSGVCIQAKDIKQVYTALNDTQTLLASNMTPALDIPANGAFYTAFLSASAKKVLGSVDSMQVRGLKADDDKTAFRFFEVDEATFNTLPEGQDTLPALVYCRAMVSQGAINAAKYALVASKSDLLLAHYRALVPTEVAAMTAAVEDAIFAPDTFKALPDYGLPTAKATVLQVLDTLASFKSSVQVNVAKLAKGYKRRGLKRVAGTRAEDGTLVPPAVRTVDRNPSDYLPLSSVDTNRNTATINVLLSKAVRLVKDYAATEHGESYTPIDEVAGISLDGLRDFKNYTIVGDGVVCTPVLTIKMSDKRCFKALSDLGVVSGEFDPTADYDLALGDLPVVDFDASFGVSAETLGNLAKLTALSKILSALTKEASEAYTAEQLAALKEVYLSGSLYFSPPTTNDYTDLQEALNTGKVDTRLSYKVELGSPSITNLGKLPSANAFLERRFTLTVDGKAVDKPKWTEFFNPNAVWGIKELSARTKLTPVDDLLFPIFKTILGLDGTTFDLNAEGVSIHFETGKGLDADKALTYRKMVDAAIDNIYGKMISPLVFYVGATGLVPDSLGAGTALTAEQLEAKFPDITLSKDEKEGTFYVLPGNVILTVYVKGEYFTVTAPVAA